jgi:hypothetical protein
MRCAIGIRDVAGGCSIAEVGSDSHASRTSHVVGSDSHASRTSHPFLTIITMDYRTYNALKGTGSRPVGRQLVQQEIGRPNRFQPAGSMAQVGSTV